jgi:hypothetical protein
MSVIFLSGLAGHNESGHNSPTTTTVEASFPGLFKELGVAAPERVGLASKDRDTVRPPRRAQQPVQLDLYGHEGLSFLSEKPVPTRRFSAIRLLRSQNLAEVPTTGDRSQ